MQLKPRKNMILVKILPKEETLRGSGLVIPHNVKSVHGEQWNAEVVAAGPGKKRKSGVIVPTQVEPGDKVILGKFAGTRIHIDDKLYFLISEDEILCTMTE
jgi:chaperonin GroES